MEAVTVEIPEEAPDGTWTPPVLSHAEPQTAPDGDAPRCTDVFLAQYTVCVLLLTLVLLLRVYAPESYAQLVSHFSAGITAPDEKWIDALLTFISRLWS